MTIYIPFIFSSQIDFDLKSINQEILLFLKLLKKYSVQYLTIQGLDFRGTQFYLGARPGT